MFTEREEVIEIYYSGKTKLGTVKVLQILLFKEFGIKVRLMRRRYSRFKVYLPIRLDTKENEARAKELIIECQKYNLRLPCSPRLTCSSI